ncbi:extensin-like protein [Cyclospora cayetanensis]|uniref:Extensin-like protein n=1 Tax=Cyclospora cayetanensis TaxID=88456 RepID=A0A1D3D160_9EIME|nr:extensin-like protein [Cyclospora cayetanensis]
MSLSSCFSPYRLPLDKDGSFSSTSANNICVLHCCGLLVLGWGERLLPYCAVSAARGFLKLRQQAIELEAPVSELLLSNCCRLLAVAAGRRAVVLPVGDCLKGCALAANTAPLSEKAATSASCLAPGFRQVEAAVLPEAVTAIAWTGDNRLLLNTYSSGLFIADGKGGVLVAVEPPLRISVLASRDPLALWILNSEESAESNSSCKSSNGVSLLPISLASLEGSLDMEAAALAKGAVPALNDAVTRCDAEECLMLLQLPPLRLDTQPVFKGRCLGISVVSPAAASKDPKSTAELPFIAALFAIGDEELEGGSHDAKQEKRPRTAFSSAAEEDAYLAEANLQMSSLLLFAHIQDARGGQQPQPGLHLQPFAAAVNEARIYLSSLRAVTRATLLALPEWGAICVRCTDTTQVSFFACNQLVEQLPDCSTRLGWGDTNAADEEASTWSCYVMPEGRALETADEDARPMGLAVFTAFSDRVIRDMADADTPLLSSPAVFFIAESAGEVTVHFADRCRTLVRNTGTEEIPLLPPLHFQKQQHDSQDEALIGAWLSEEPPQKLTTADADVDEESSRRRNNTSCGSGSRSSSSSSSSSATRREDHSKATGVRRHGGFTNGQEKQLKSGSSQSAVPSLRKDRRGKAKQSTSHSSYREAAGSNVWSCSGKAAREAALAAAEKALHAAIPRGNSSAIRRWQERLQLSPEHLEVETLLKKASLRSLMEKKASLELKATSRMLWLPPFLQRCTLQQQQQLLLQRVMGLREKEETHAERTTAEQQHLESIALLSTVAAETTPKERLQQRKAVRERAQQLRQLLLRMQQQQQVQQEVYEEQLALTMGVFNSLEAAKTLPQGLKRLGAAVAQQTRRVILLLGRADALALEKIGEVLPEARPSQQQSQQQKRIVAAFTAAAAPSCTGKSSASRRQPCRPGAHFALPSEVWEEGFEDDTLQQQEQVQVSDGAPAKAVQEELVAALFPSQPLQAVGCRLQQSLFIETSEKDRENPEVAAAGAADAASGSGEEMAAPSLQQRQQEEERQQNLGGVSELLQRAKVLQDEASNLEKSLSAVEQQTPSCLPLSKGLLAEKESEFHEFLHFLEEQPQHELREQQQGLNVPLSEAKKPRLPLMQQLLDAEVTRRAREAAGRRALLQQLQLGGRVEDCAAGTAQGLVAVEADLLLRTQTTLDAFEAEEGEHDFEWETLESSLEGWSDDGALRISSSSSSRSRSSSGGGSSDSGSLEHRRYSSDRTTRRGVDASGSESEELEGATLSEADTECREVSRKPVSASKGTHNQPLASANSETSPSALFPDPAKAVVPSSHPNTRLPLSASGVSLPPDQGGSSSPTRSYSEGGGSSPARSY